MKSLTLKARAEQNLTYPATLCKFRSYMKVIHNMFNFYV